LQFADQRSLASKDKLVDEEVVANVDGILHRAGWHGHRLGDEGHQEEGHDDGDQQLLGIVANDTLRRTVDRCGINGWSSLDILSHAPKNTPFLFPRAIREGESGRAIDKVGDGRLA
jgi:hypothetical protein